MFSCVNYDSDNALLHCNSQRELSYPYFLLVESCDVVKFPNLHEKCRAKLRLHHPNFSSFSARESIGSDQQDHKGVSRVE